MHLPFLCYANMYQDSKFQKYHWNENTVTYQMCLKSFKVGNRYETRSKYVS